jgi:hypothetical protein
VCYHLKLHFLSSLLLLFGSIYTFIYGHLGCRDSGFLNDLKMCLEPPRSATNKPDLVGGGRLGGLPATKHQTHRASSNFCLGCWYQPPSSLLLLAIAIESKLPQPRDDSLLSPSPAAQQQIALKEKVTRRLYELLRQLPRILGLHSVYRAPAPLWRPPCGCSNYVFLS